jgi:hypothetical protein
MVVGVTTLLTLKAQFVTDGDDNRSKTTVDNLLAVLPKEPLMGLVIVGVGSDIQPANLQRLAASTRKGTYIGADSSQESITEAFSQVAKLIQVKLIGCVHCLLMAGVNCMRVQADNVTLEEF